MQIKIVGSVIFILSATSSVLQYKLSVPYKKIIEVSDWVFRPALLSDGFEYPESEYTAFIPMSEHKKGKTPTIITRLRNGESVGCDERCNINGDVIVGVAQPIDIIIVIK